MDATEVAKALVEWAAETCPDLNSAYDYGPESITEALPVALAAISDEQDAPNAAELGLEISFGLEQAAVHVVRCSIELIVPPKPGEGASRQLEEMVGLLANALRSEWQGTAQITLGGRVGAASPYWQASYEPTFIQFEDGTEGRRASFSLAVAELI